MVPCGRSLQNWELMAKTLLELLEEENIFEVNVKKETLR